MFAQQRIFLKEKKIISSFNRFCSFFIQIFVVTKRFLFLYQTSETIKLDPKRKLTKFIYVNGFLIIYKIESHYWTNNWR
jgi:hypothetical protein